MTSHRRKPDSRQGFTVLELLVVVAIIGVLIGLVLPSIVSAREAARKITCTNHLRQLGIAIQQHHDVRRMLPSAWKPVRQSTSVYGWAVPLLPFMEQTRVYESLKSKSPITAVTSSPARETSIKVMLCPSDIVEAFFPLFVDDEKEDGKKDGNEVGRVARRTDFDSPSDRSPLTILPTANYVGVFGTVEADDGYPAPVGDGAMIVDRRVRFGDLRRGLSRTLLVGERTMAMIPSTWLGVDMQGEDATCRLVGSAMTAPNCSECDECEFASRHIRGVNFLWADGHVGMLSNEIDSHEYRQLARRNLSSNLPPY